MENEEKNKLDLAYEAIQNYEVFVKQNSLSDDEKVDIKLYPKDSDKKSTARYDSPDGTIKVTYNPVNKQATVQTDFITGKFKATIESDNIISKGQAPVLFPHWGSFNAIFDDE